jgi:hypothetical protein
LVKGRGERFGELLALLNEGSGSQLGIAMGIRPGF